MAGKPQHSAFAPACPIRHSLLAVAVLALICFALLSLRSLRFHPQFSSPTMAVAEVSRDLASPGLSSSSIYHSPEVFFKSYAEMEGNFKVFIYPDGDPNTYFQTPRKLTGKYASEGYFFQNIRESRFRTEDPDQADLFFVPISCHKMRGKALGFFPVYVMGSVIRNRLHLATSDDNEPFIVSDLPHLMHLVLFELPDFIRGSTSLKSSKRRRKAA